MPRRMLHILDSPQHLLTIEPPFMCEYWWFKSSLWLCVTTCLWKPLRAFVTSLCGARSRERFSVYTFSFFFPSLYKSVFPTELWDGYIFTLHWWLWTHLKIMFSYHWSFLALLLGGDHLWISNCHVSASLMLFCFLRLHV